MFIQHLMCLESFSQRFHGCYCSSSRFTWGEKGKFLSKSLLNAIVFSEVAKSHLSPVSPSHLLFFTHPHRRSSLGQSFFSLCRTFFWLLCWDNNYISREFHLRLDLSGLKHLGFGFNISYGCEFLAFVASRVCFEDPSYLHFKQKLEEGPRAPWRKAYCIVLGRKYEDLEYLVIARKQKYSQRHFDDKLLCLLMNFI